MKAATYLLVFLVVSSIFQSGCFLFKSEQKAPTLDPNLLPHSWNGQVDSDGDGIGDSDEIYKYHTDPHKWDSDGDRLNDFDEVFRYRTDANKTDTDGDGISDGDEVLKYQTDPLSWDTDGDGLSD